MPEAVVNFFFFKLGDILFVKEDFYQTSPFLDSTVFEISIFFCKFLVSIILELSANALFKKL